MSFDWNRKNIKTQEAAYLEAEQATPIVLNEEVMAEIQGDSQYDVFEEEEENTADLMVDANLRLEMGRLFQMILQNDIFAETNADPRAIKNVQREIRKFVRDRLEIMLGIRQESVVKETIVSSPFNDLEVEALKMLASRVSGGKTEQINNAPMLQNSIPVPPKKDGITAISGNLRPKETTTPLRKEAKAPLKPQIQTKKQATPAKSAIKQDDSFLPKPIDDMTQEEKIAYDKAAAERSARNYAVMPNNLVPHPSPGQLEMMYAATASQLSIANPPGRMRMY